MQLGNLLCHVVSTIHKYSCTPNAIEQVEINIYYSQHDDLEIIHCPPEESDHHEKWQPNISEKEESQKQQIYK